MNQTIVNKLKNETFPPMVERERARYTDVYPEKDTATIVSNLQQKLDRYLVLISTFNFETSQFRKDFVTLNDAFQNLMLEHLPECYYDAEMLLFLVNYRVGHLTVPCRRCTYPYFLYLFYFNPYYTHILYRECRLRLDKALHDIWDRLTLPALTIYRKPGKRNRADWFQKSSFRCQHCLDICPRIRHPACCHKIRHERTIDDALKMAVQQGDTKVVEFYYTGENK